ncbi:phage major capsid protein [Pseudaestuariivita rosea]|uniref:phage major capsid protein n=1 Tax=Pseudaestuariivita rosea TaxID=2763263 RepID=UPI001ABA23A4|nr:phage major capsid protein [Pseudaestuariivita rosea]
MLESVVITRRQSEIRQQLSELAAKPEPTEDELRSMDDMDREYRTNETRYRAALIAEDEERQEAGAELETRSAQEWSDMLAGFEMRQVALALDEGRQLDGQTAEIVTELRSAGGFRGIPVPWEALELRAGETTAPGTPNPIQTRPIIDRLFPQSVASRMGGQMINVPQGEVEYPVVTSAVSASWQGSETGNTASPQRYQTADRPLKPDNTLGIQMKLTRKSMKQSGAALEQAVRRDMNGAIAAEMDRVTFQGAGTGGEPNGVVAGAGSYGITETAVAAAASWSAFRGSVTRFMLANAAGAPSAVRLLIRPEVWDTMDDAYIDTGTGVTEWDRLVKNIPASNIAMSPNSLAAPTGTPEASSALLTTNVGGVAPFFVATWGAVDVIRDPYSDAQQGALRLTALATMDITIARPVQLEVLTGIQ